MAQNATASPAESDDDYLDDVVVRAALERLQREFEDSGAVRSVISERFGEVAPTKTDYIKIHLESGMWNSHTLGNIVQEAVDTGVVRIDEIETEREYIRVAPTE